MAVDYQLVTCRDDFDALADDWADLERRAGQGRHLFQSHNWLWHWANHFLPDLEAEGHRLAICTGRVGDRLVVVWPTLLEAHGPVSKLVWMGAPFNHCGDVLVEAMPDADRVIAESLKFIKSTAGADLLELSQVRADALVSQLLLGLRAEKTSSRDVRAISLKTLSTSAEIPALGSRRARNMQKRKRARLSSSCETGMVRVSAGPEASALLAASQTHTHFATSFPMRESGQGQASKMERFCRDLASGNTKPVGFEVFALYAEGKATAMTAGILDGDTYISLLTCVEPKFRKYSAAALLMEDVVGTVCLGEQRSLEFMGAANPFTRQWSTTGVEVADWQVAISPLGLIYMKLKDGLVHQTARSARKTFAGMRR